MNQPETQTDVAPETDVALTEEELWALDDEALNNPEAQETKTEPAPDAETETKAEPDPEPGPETPPETDSEPPEGETAKDEGPQEPEWWQQLPDEARNEIQQTYSQQQQMYERMQEQYQSLYGRVAPTQRKLAEAIAQRDSLIKQLEAYSDAPSNLEELEKTDTFKQLVKDFPEDAEAIKSTFAQLLSKQQQDVNAKLEETQRALQDERQAHAQREMNRLNQAHSDWQVWVNSNEFNVWRNALSPQDQQRVQQMLSSPYADENIEVLNVFKRDLQTAQEQARQGVTPNSEGKPAGSQQSQTQNPPRKKPPSVSPPSEGSGISGSRRVQVPQSEEELWGAVSEDELDQFRRRAG